MSDKRVAAVILAAGSGSRMRSDTPKQYMVVSGKSVLQRTVEVFDLCSEINMIAVVVRKGEIDEIRDKLSKWVSKPFKVICGGINRAESAIAGFEAVECECDFVAIHDCARCLVKASDISKVIFEAKRHGAATACTAVTDSLKLVDNAGSIISSVFRDSYRAMQTPQIFDRTLYRRAIDASASDLDSITDDNGMMERIGISVKCVETSKYNIKITTQEDISYAEFLLSRGVI